jgi:hypothetical protein
VHPERPFAQWRSQSEAGPQFKFAAAASQGSELASAARFSKIRVGKSLLAGDFWVYVGKRSLESL